VRGYTKGMNRVAERFDESVPVAGFS